jgi:hypothetical protein
LRGETEQSEGTEKLKLKEQNRGGKLSKKRRTERDGKESERARQKWGEKSHRCTSTSDSTVPHSAPPDRRGWPRKDREEKGKPSKK